MGTSNWEIVVPAGRDNLCRDATFWTDPDAGGSNFWYFNSNLDWSYVVGDGWDSGRCIELQASAGDSYYEITSQYSDYGIVQVAQGQTTHLSVYAKAVEAGSYIRLTIYDNTHDSGYTSTVQATTAWKRYTLSWTNTVGAANCYIKIATPNNAGLALARLRVDAVLWEIGDDASSFFTGDYPGCRWLGKRHDSVSRRSAIARSGGVRNDLKDTYGFGVTDIIDAGSPQVEHHIHSFAQSPGGEIRGSKIHQAAFALAGVLKNRGTDLTLKQLREALTGAIAPWAYPKSGDQYQPVRLINTAGDTEVFIDAHCENPGFNEAVTVQNVFGRYQKFSIEWLAEFPFWQQLGSNGKNTGGQSSTYLRLFGAMLASSGTLSGLGVNSITSGRNINAAVYNPIDGRVYFTGEFYGINGDSGYRFFCWYDPATGEFGVPAGTGTLASDFTTSSYGLCLAVKANGDVLVGGTFYPNGGGEQYVLLYDISGDDFDAFSYLQPSASVSDIVVEPGTNNFYVLMNDANPQIQKYTGYPDYYVGLNYTLTGTINDIFVDEYGYMYIVMNSSEYDGWLLKYNLTSETITDLGGYPDIPYTPHLGRRASNGMIYLVGSDTSLYKDALFRYNGSRYEKLGDVQIGLTDPDGGSGNYGYINDVHVAPDGSIIVAGTFTKIVRPDGSLLETNVGLAYYRGDAWHRYPMRPNSDPYTSVGAVATAPSDAVLPNMYDIYFGFDTGTYLTAPRSLLMQYAETKTLTNGGNANSYPTFYCDSYLAGTNILRVIANLTTGQIVEFDYKLGASEVLKVEFTTTGPIITSNTKGARPDALLPGTMSSELYLAPGDNLIYIFTKQSGTSGIDLFQAKVVWRDTYSGVG